MIAERLNVGGVFYMVEFHPILWMMDYTANTPELKYHYNQKGVICFSIFSFFNISTLLFKKKYIHENIEYFTPDFLRKKSDSCAKQTRSFILTFATELERHFKSLTAFQEIHTLH